MTHIDLSFLRRRLKNSQAYFEGRFAPPAVMEKRPVVNDRFVKFLQLGRPAMRSVRNLQLSFSFFSVDEKPVRRLAQVALLAGDDRKAEEGLMPLAFFLPGP